MNRAHHDRIVARQRTIDAARTFKAWRVTTSATYPLDIGQPDTLTDALNECQLGSALQHKETVLVHEYDAGEDSGTLRAYAVKQKSQPLWIKCPQTGVSKPMRPLYLDALFAVAVRDFDPVRPFDAFADCPVGFDRTLVEQR